MRIRTILTTLMLMASVTMSAQVNNVQTDEYKNEVRQELNLDYSMPDYTTHKVDAKVMGPHLAAILQELFAKYKQDCYLSVLSSIQAEQIDGLDYCTIEKLGLVNVTKSGNTITIHFKTTLAKNPLELKKSDLIMTFIDGVSENKKVNSLFSNICNYMK